MILSARRRFRARQHFSTSRQSDKLSLLCVPFMASFRCTYIFLSIRLWIFFPELLYQAICPILPFGTNCLFANATIQSLGIEKQRAFPPRCPRGGGYLGLS